MLLYEHISIMLPLVKSLLLNIDANPNGPTYHTNRNLFISNIKNKKKYVKQHILLIFTRAYSCLFAFFYYYYLFIQGHFFF